MWFFRKVIDTNSAPVSDFIEIAEEAHQRKKKQKMVDETRDIISSVLSEVSEVSEVWETPDMHRPWEEWAQTVINLNGVNISDDSEIIIPKWFGYNFPLVPFLMEKESLPLSEVLQMDRDQREAITEAIAWQEIQIRVWDTVLNIDLDTRCSINWAEWSLRQYILSPHQINLQEIT